MSTNNPPREGNKHLVFGQIPRSWTKNLEDEISPAAAREGRNYFHGRSIDIRSSSREHVEAWAPGLTAKSVVKIDVRDETVLVSCACQDFRDRGNICSHIWGVILTCERKGCLGRIGEIQDPVIEADDDAVFDLEAGENRIEDRTKTSPPPKAPKTSSKPKTEPWKEHFAALRSAFALRLTENGERDRRVIYIIDPSESVSRKGVVLRTALSNRKKNGEWGKPAIYERSIRDVHQLDPADQNILGLLSGAKDVYGYYASNPQTEYRLPTASQQLLVPMLCATGRCHLASPGFRGDTGNMSPLVWDDGPSWRLLIQIRRDERSASYKISAKLSRGGSAISAATPLLLLPGLVFFKDRVSRFDDGGVFEWVNVLRRNGTLSVPFASRPELLSEMASFPALPPLATPEELRIEQRNLDRPPVVKIRPPENPMHSQPKLRCEVLFDYGGIQVSEAHAGFAVPDPASDRFFARDRGAESAALAKLAALGLRRAQSWQKHRWELASSKLPATVRSLVSEGWQVEAEGKLYRRAGSINIEVRSGIDWFDLEGIAEFEGAPVRMPELLKAIARGENMVRLDDGSFGVVPEDWVKRYGLLAKMGHTGDGQVRFGRHQAGLLDALLASEPAASFDAGFLRVREQLASFAGLQPADPAPAFQGTLREYQREGLGWLHFLRRFGFGGCLADDMGLGKTVQVLAMLESGERRGPALVVVPRSLVFNWKQEVMRFAPQLRVLDLTGNGRKDQWSEIPAYDIALSTYGTLRRDAALLKDIRFDTVVLDEAQTIKNASTESAKAARLLKADHRLVMTGTPVENRINDLWSLFEFLNPGMLGTAAVFRAHAAAADDSLRILSQALRPFILRRTKEQVARELPPKTEQTIYCELEPDQRRLYNELRDHYRDSLLGRIDEVGIEKSRMHILEALLRLRQAACHPGLIDKNRSGESSAKIDALLPQLQEVIEGGHKVLVFSQFTSLLAILKQRLDAEKIQYEYLDGRTRDRQGRVQHFQDDPDCRIFLISLKAGGLGLNLTSAEYVFLLDPWWNPAVEAQAIDRSHRIGQSRHVFAYRLIARDTIEEKVLDLQKTKREIAGAIITADNSVIAGLGREHLELLLS